MFGWFKWGGIDSPSGAERGEKLSGLSALTSGLTGGMPDLFSVTLSFICVGCVALAYLFTRSGLEKKDGSKDKTDSIDGGHNPAFLSLQRSYLTVYLLGVAGDWLQGPYVYALYEFYGMSKHQIELLFIAGFASSLVFGTFIGSIADKYGRRTNCFLYAFLYGLACLTKHFADFNILLLGRLLGGIATSILFSAFESWLVYEHNQRGIDSPIVSGMGAQVAADFFGYVAPFDVALILLIIMVVIMVGTWPENYGDSKAPVHQSFVDAFYTIKNGLIFKTIATDEKRFLKFEFARSSILLPMLFT
uniref:Molybdate-anion transporter n=1 Tax=Ditylenchus dipsaci TaxID=166011 RepID=A0A915DSQ4_9BILA